MNIYQSFLQTNTKTGNLFKKGFQFSKMSFFFLFDGLAAERGLSYGITYFFNIVCLKTVRAKRLEQSLNHTRLPVTD